MWCSVVYIAEATTNYENLATFPKYMRQFWQDEKRGVVQGMLLARWFLHSRTSRNAWKWMFHVGVAFKKAILEVGCKLELILFVDEKTRQIITHRGAASKKKCTSTLYSRDNANNKWVKHAGKKKHCILSRYGCDRVFFVARAWLYFVCDTSTPYYLVLDRSKKRKSFLPHTNTKIKSQRTELYHPPIILQNAPHQFAHFHYPMYQAYPLYYPLRCIHLCRTPQINIIHRASPLSK